MKLYFDDHGRLKYFEKELLTATSHGQKLYIYADFDKVINTNLLVTATFKRSDGFVVGPLPAEEHIDNNYNLCRVVELIKPVLAVPGQLELTVRYDYYGFNSFGEKVRVSTRALAKTVAHVYDAVGGLPEEEKLGLYFILDKLNEHEQRLNSISDDFGANLILMFNGEDITNQAVMVVDVNDHESTNSHFISTSISNFTNTYKNELSPYNNTTKNTYKNELSPYRK